MPRILSRRIGLSSLVLWLLMTALAACGNQNETSLSLPAEARETTAAALASATATNSATPGSTTAPATVGQGRSESGPGPAPTSTPVRATGPQLAPATPAASPSSPAPATPGRTSGPSVSTGPDQSGPTGAARATATPRLPARAVSGYPGKLVIGGAEKALYLLRLDGSPAQLVLGKAGVRAGGGQDGAILDWPTWSRDGSKLAVMSLNVQGGQFSGADIIVMGADGKNPVKLQDASPNQPIFISWSPDGNQLSLLVSGQSSGLELSLLDTSKAPAVAPRINRKVAEGAMVYTGWSPDSQQLLVHTTSDKSNSVFLLAAKDAKSQAVPLKGSPSTFRAPSFSSDGTRLAFAATNAQSGTEEIVITDKAGAGLGTIEMAGRSSAFAWSPTASRLAHTSVPANGQGINKGISLTEVDGRTPAGAKLTGTSVTEEPVIAFFWSPDGKKLAYVGFNNQGNLLAWKLYDLDTKKTVPLVEWYPSDNWLQLVRFFDQYTPHNSIWSPDSRGFVFAGYTKDDVTMLAGQSADDVPPTVYLMPLDGIQAGVPVPLASGGVAFWAK